MVKKFSEDDYLVVAEAKKKMGDNKRKRLKKTQSKKPQQFADPHSLEGFIVDDIQYGQKKHPK